LALEMHFTMILQLLPNCNGPLKLLDGFGHPITSTAALMPKTSSDAPRSSMVEQMALPQDKTNTPKPKVVLMAGPSEVEEPLPQHLVATLAMAALLDNVRANGDTAVLDLTIVVAVHLLLHPHLHQRLVPPMAALLDNVRANTDTVVLDLPIVVEAHLLHLHQHLARLDLALLDSV